MSSTAVDGTSAQVRRNRMRRGRLILLAAVVVTRLAMYLQVAIPEGDFWPFP